MDAVEEYLTEVEEAAEDVLTTKQQVAQHEQLHIQSTVIWEGGNTSYRKRRHSQC